MKVSIVIPTLNEEKYISLLLNDILEQTIKPYEVIIVDGDSEDKTVEVIKKFPFAKVISTERGVSHQRNIGGSNASGDIIIFLDADTRLRPDFLEKCVTQFEKHNLDVACPLFIPYRSTLIINALFWFLNLIFILLQRILPSGAGPCILIKKETFNLSNKFNESIKFEDMEFIRRVARKSKYGILNTRIFVSDRRFRKNGAGKMILLYVLLSFLFTFGLFETASKLSYPFGNYEK